jgi:uncharacterized protein
VTSLRLPVVSARVDSVQAAVHEPTGDATDGLAVLLVPGAGGDLDGAPLIGLAALFADLGVTAVRANLPHHEAGRRAPRADRAVPGFRQVFDAARDEVAPGAHWLTGGKSYGGRVATLAAAEGGLDAVGLVLHGYPLHPPGKPDQLRVEHWPQVRLKTLFLQGSRDAFGPAAELEPHLTKLPRRATLLTVQGGDHSLDVAGVHAPDGVRRSASEVLARLAAPVGVWLRGLLSD